MVGLASEWAPDPPVPGECVGCSSSVILTHPSSYLLSCGAAILLQAPLGGQVSNLFSYTLSLWTLDSCSVGQAGELELCKTEQRKSKGVQWPGCPGPHWMSRREPRLGWTSLSTSLPRSLSQSLLCPFFLSRCRVHLLWLSFTGPRSSLVFQMQASFKAGGLKVPWPSRFP